MKSRLTTFLFLAFVLTVMAAGPAAAAPKH